MKRVYLMRTATHSLAFFSYRLLFKYCKKNGINKFTVEILDVPVLSVPNI